MHLMLILLHDADFHAWSDVEFRYVMLILLHDADFHAWSDVEFR